MAVLRNYDHNPDAARYQAIQAFKFGVLALTASQVSGTVQLREPIPFNMKILSVTALLSGTVAGTCSINFALGTAALAGVGTPDNRLTGTVPPSVATSGQQLFSSNQAVTMTADTVTQIFTGADSTADTWDVIWPTGGELTLRTVTNGAASGNLQVALAIVPIFLHYNYPDTFHPWSPVSSMQ